MEYTCYRRPHFCLHRSWKKIIQISFGHREKGKSRIISFFNDRNFRRFRGQRLALRWGWSGRRNRIWRRRLKNTMAGAKKETERKNPMMWSATTSTGKNFASKGEESRFYFQIFEKFHPMRFGDFVAVVFRLSSAAVASILIASKISQLTIFYDGKVCVYDDVPPEKVKFLRDLYSSGESEWTIVL